MRISNQIKQLTKNIPSTSHHHSAPTPAPAPAPTSTAHRISTPASASASTSTSPTPIPTPTSISPTLRHPTATSPQFASKRRQVESFQYSHTPTSAPIPIHSGFVQPVLPTIPVLPQEVGNGVPLSFAFSSSSSSSYTPLIPSGMDSSYPISTPPSTSSPITESNEVPLISLHSIPSTSASGENQPIPIIRQVY